MSTVEKFNLQQRDALKKICDALEGVSADNITRYVGYYPQGEESFCVEKFAEEPQEELHNYLNYYWCEYEKGKNQYRITMFYKDFDCGSGNIHVLPGAIQVWKKVKCESGEKVFCEETLSQCKRKKTGEISYKMVGGKPYCEYGWKPLLGDVMYWDDDILNEFISNIDKEDFRSIKRTKIITSDVFYANVMEYSSKGRSGNKNRYWLLKFYGEKLYYKTRLEERHGYFTKYDGEEVSFSKGDGMNECGPNYYDDDEGKWIIKERLYDEKKTNVVS